MTVKDLIKELLNHSMQKEVRIVYPVYQDKDGNYSAYKEGKTIEVVENTFSLMLGINNDNK